MNEKLNEDKKAKKHTDSGNSSYTLRVKELRDRLGLKQDEFVSKIVANGGSMSTTTLSGLENQNKPLSLKMAKEIADTFDVSLDWLFERSADKNDEASNIIYSLKKIFEFQWNEKHDRMSVVITNNLNTYLLNLSEAEKTKKTTKHLSDVAYNHWIEGIKKEYNQVIKTAGYEEKHEYILCHISECKTETVGANVGNPPRN